MNKRLFLFRHLGLIGFANAGEAPEPCGPAGQLSRISKMLGLMHDILSCACIR